MKNFNLIERLWTDSHEKQRVRGMRRYAAMITLLLTLACGQMWGTDYYLISDDALNTTNFVAGGTFTKQSSGVNISGVKYACYTTSGNQNSASVSGAYTQGKVLQYHCQTTATTLVISRYNSSSSSISYYHNVIAEGATGDLADATAHACTGYSNLNDTIVANGSTNRTIYIYLKSSNTSIKFLNVKAIESGTALSKAGEAGYSFNFNNGRLLAAKNADGGVPNEGLVFHLGNANYGCYNTANAMFTTSGTDYVKFSTGASAVTLSVTTGATAAYSVNKVKAYNADSAQTSPTSGEATDFTLDANSTYYINPNGTNIKLTKIQFSAASVACPAFSFHTGGSDVWNTHEADYCFTQVGSTKEWRVENYTRENHTHYVVNWQSGKYSTGGDNSASFASHSWSDMSIALARAAKVGESATGVQGILRIYANSGDENLYVGFIPAGYVVRRGSDNFATTGDTESDVETVWRTGLQQITSSNAASTLSVGLKTSSGSADYSQTKSVRQIFFRPNSNWTSDGAEFYIYYWGDETSWGDDKLIDPDGDGIYEGWIPASGVTGFKFVRENPEAEGKPAFGSGKAWNETGNLTAVSGKNLFTIPDGAWSGTDNGTSDANWSLYEKYGQYRVWADKSEKNFHLHFYPHYAVLFDAGDGSGSMDAQSVAVDAATKNITLAACSLTPPTGYEFSHWTADVDVTISSEMVEAGEEIDDGATLQSVGSDITLTAHWSPVTYTITLAKGTQGAADQSATVAYDATELTSITHVTATGYDRTGYYSGSTKVLNADGSFAKDDVTGFITGGKWSKADDCTLTAKWTAQTYNIIYKDKGNVDLSGAHNPVYAPKHTYGSETTLAKASKSGYVFEGWYTESDCSSGKVTTLGATAYTASPTLYANWVAMDLDALESGVLYKAEDMVTAGQVIETTQRYRAGVSESEMFNILGSGTSDASGGPMGAIDATSGEADATIDGTDFATTLNFKGNAASAGTSGSTLPTSRAIQFVISDAGQLDIYCNYPSKIYLIKSGDNTAQIDADGTSTAKITKAVTAGTYYLYARSGDAKLYGLKFTPTYTVTYNKNDEDATGSVTDASSPYVSGSRVVVEGPGDLALDDNIFVGWNDIAKGSGTYYSPKSNFSISDNKILYAQWRDASGTTCPDGSSEGTVFSLAGKDNSGGSAKNLSYGEAVDLSAYATITNGAASLTDIRTSSGDTKATITKANPAAVQLVGNDAMLTLYLDCALAEGDIISYTSSESVELCFTTSPTRATTIYTSSKSYTIPAESSLLGTHILYVWRATSSTVSITELTITRPVACTDPSASLSDESYTIGGSSLDLRTLWSSSNTTDGVTFSITSGTGTIAGDGYTFSSSTAGSVTISASQSSTGDYCDAAETATITVSNPTYTVTYTTTGSTGGSAPTDSNSPYESGSTVTVLGNTGSLVKTGYVFRGWVDGSSNKYAPGETFTISGNTTLSPIWVEGTAGTVTYNLTVNTSSTKFNACASSTPTSGDLIASSTINTYGTAGACSSNSSNTSHTQKLNIDASYTAANYYEWTCAIAKGKAFTPTQVSIHFWGVTKAVSYKVILTDGTTEYSTTFDNSADGKDETLTWNIASGDAFASNSTMRLKIWAYANVSGATAFRLGTPIIINGVVSNGCTLIDAEGGTGSVASITKSGASLPYTLTETTNVASVTIKVYDDEDNLVETIEDLAAATSGSGSATGLSAGTTYYYTVTPIGESGYCDGEESDPSDEFTTLYSVTYAAGVTLTSGSVPTDANGYTSGANATVLGNTGNMVYGSETFLGWTDGTTFYVADNKFTITANTTLTAVWSGSCIGGVSSSTTDVAASGYTAYQEVGGSSVVFTSTPSLGFKYKDLDGNTINNPTEATTRNNAYSCQINSSSSNRGAIKTNSSYSNVDSISFYFATDTKAYGEVAVWYSTDNFSKDSTNLMAKTALASGKSNNEFYRKVLALPVDKKENDLTFKFRFTVNGTTGKIVYIDSLKVYTSVSGSSCFDVTFADGSVAPASHTTWPDNLGGVPTGKKIVQPADPTADGYIFRGWYADEGCETAFDFSGTITRDTTLYAKWTGEIAITGNIWLTSYNGVSVYATSTTSNLITVSSPNVTGATRYKIIYLDGSGDEVAKASSRFRLCNNGTEDNYTYVDASSSYVAVSSGEYSQTYSICYTPNAYNTIDVGYLKLQLLDGSTVLSEATLTLHGRALPEEFVIATKGNDNIWYALPNTIVDNSSAVAPIRITVDNETTPTAASYAPNTTVYKGDGRYNNAKNRYGVRFTDGVLKDSKLNHLQISSSTSTHYPWLSYTGSSTNQDWWLKSTDCSAYELNVPTSGATSAYKLGIYGGNIGYFSSVTSGSIFLLPITNKYTDVPATATEWGQHSVILAANPGATATKAQARIEGGEPTDDQTISAINAAMGTAKNVKVPVGDIDLADLASNEGKLLYIDWYNSSSTLLGTSCVTIPRIIAANRNMKTDGEPLKNAWTDKEVHVLPGFTLTANTSDYATNPGTATIKELHIYPGATLNVSTGTLTATTLRLHNGWTRAGEKQYNTARVYIADDAALTKTTASMDYDIYELTDGKHYYPLAVPFETAVSSIDYADSYLAGFSTYGTHYGIKAYDGARRAEQGPDQANNWSLVAGDATLAPGKGYIMTAVAVKGEAIIRIPLTYNDAWTADGEKGTAHYDDADHTKNVVAVTAHTGTAATANKSNAGWNMLGVPFMSCYSTNAKDMIGEEETTFINGKLILTGDPSSPLAFDDKDEHIYVNVPTHDFSEYLQTVIDETTLLPGWCFMVQIGTSGNLTFLTSAQAESSSTPIYAPRRERAEMPVEKTGIILSGGEASDRTTILVSDKYSAADYEINADLEKLFGNGYTLATYSLSGSTRLAYNAMSTSDATAVIPIGYRAPAEGEYTFSINPRYAESGAFSRVDLIDYETSTVTNLLYGPYTFESDRTQNDARFALNVVMAPQTPTDIESISDEGLEMSGAHKMIIDDKLYIILDGKMYDATGKVVKGGQK